MAKVRPYYSINPTDGDVYHNYDDCPAGQEILPQDRRLGDGGYHRCEKCQGKDYGR